MWTCGKCDRPEKLGPHMSKVLNSTSRGRLFMKVTILLMHLLTVQNVPEAEIKIRLNRAPTIRSIFQSFYSNHEHVRSDTSDRIQKFRMFVMSHFDLLMAIARDYVNAETEWTSFDVGEERKIRAEYLCE